MRTRCFSWCFVVMAIFLAVSTIGSVAVAQQAVAQQAAAQGKAPADTKKAAPPAAVSIALDPSFGTGGFVSDLLDAKAQIGALGRFLAVDKEGRPVLAGNTPGQRFSLGRYTVDGKPDPTFADKGKTSICIEDEATVEGAGTAEVQFTHGGAIDTKGRIVIIGKGAGIDGARRWDFALLRFLPNGQPDKSFADVGYRKLQAHESWNIGLAATTGKDCSVLAAGYAQVAGAPVTDPLLIRLNEAGVVDEPFSAAANGSLRWLATEGVPATATGVALDAVGSSRVDLQACKLEYSIVSPK